MSQRGLNAHQVAHKTGSRYNVPRKKLENVIYQCLTCGKECVASSVKRNKYCSIVCQAQKTISINFEKILANETVSFYILRNYLLKYNCKCSECGISDTYNNKPITLQCDHIDGDSDNNVLTNVRLLCPNCHSQTDTWCGRNKKNSKRSNRHKKWRDS